MAKGERVGNLPAPRKRITDEQKQQFLELISTGKTRPTAAREVGLTGSRFRTLCNPLAPSYDPEFAQAYALALEQSHAGIVDELRDEYLHCAFDRDNPHQQRAIHNNLVFYDPEYRAAHQQRMAVGAKATQDGEIQILLAFTGADGGDG